MFREAMEGRIQSLGENNPSSLYTMTRLATFLRDDVRTPAGIAGAERLYARALEGQRQRLGYVHADTLSTALSLGECLLAEDTEDATRRALVLAEEAHAGFRQLSDDPEHKDTKKAKALLDKLQISLAKQSGDAIRGSRQVMVASAVSGIATTTTTITHPNGTKITVTTKSRTVAR